MRGLPRRGVRGDERVHLLDRVQDLEVRVCRRELELEDEAVELGDDKHEGEALLQGVLHEALRV